MENQIKNLLKRLTEVPGVSGYETNIGKIIYNELKGHVDSIETDNFGNVISLKKASAKDAPKIMLAGHMDEIGLLIKHIDEKGFLHFERIGGVSPRSLFSQPVTVHGKKGPVSGLTYSKPAETPEEASKMPDFKTFFIDIGAQNKKEAEKLGVRIGDPVTFERPFKTLGSGNILASKAFDDRVGVCVIIETMKNLAKTKLETNVYGVADVQEEVGCRGAQVSAYRIAPDMAIAVDITLAGDIPGIADKDQVTKVGGGHKSHGRRRRSVRSDRSSKSEGALGFNRRKRKNPIPNGSPATRLNRRRHNPPDKGRCSQRRHIHPNEIRPLLRGFRCQ